MDWEKQETMRILQSRPGTVYQESNDSEKQVYREWLKKMLQTGVTTVTFVKADGSLRDMRATLDPAYIPQAATANPLPLTEFAQVSVKQPKNDDVCKVWDTETSAWRSFRYDRIKSITLELS